MSPRVPCVSAARHGFTLLELLVALVVSAVVLLGARAISETLADGAHRSTVAATEADRSGNAERLLREVVGRIEVADRDDRRFDGRSTGARFSSWCAVPAGWLERCSGALLLDTASVRDGGGHDGSRRRALLLVLSTGDSITLRTGFERGSLWYIAASEEGSPWYSEWGKGITVPAAIGVVIDSDTTFVRLGDRG